MSNIKTVEEALKYLATQVQEGSLAVLFALIEGEHYEAAKSIIPQVKNSILSNTVIIDSQLSSAPSAETNEVFTTLSTKLEGLIREVEALRILLSQTIDPPAPPAPADPAPAPTEAPAEIQAP